MDNWQRPHSTPKIAILSKNKSKIQFNYSPTDQLKPGIPILPFPSNKVSLPPPHLVQENILMRSACPALQPCY